MPHQRSDPVDTPPVGDTSAAATADGAVVPGSGVHASLSSPDLDLQTLSRSTRPQVPNGVWHGSAGSSTAVVAPVFKDLSPSARPLYRGFHSRSNAFRHQDFPIPRRFCRRRAGLQFSMTGNWTGRRRIPSLPHISSGRSPPGIHSRTALCQAALNADKPCVGWVPAGTTCSWWSLMDWVSILGIPIVNRRRHQHSYR